MSPASGNKTSGKLYPSATLEDQEAIEMAEMEPIVLGHPPFSSDNPRTDGVRMLPLEDGTSASQARAEAAEASSEEMKAKDWKAEVEKADSQEALDEIVNRYEDSGAVYKTVEEAIEKKQDELNS